jgi:hypothetical protein
MSKWKYRKLEPSHVRGLCCECKTYPQKRKGKNKYGTLCSSCDKKAYTSKEAKEKSLISRKQYYKTRGYTSRQYTIYKTNCCVMCNFTSEFPCQFDVDHIDGNHNNNEVSNLQTLCANCHRLKTYLNREGIYKYHP